MTNWVLRCSIRKLKLNRPRTSFGTGAVWLVDRDGPGTDSEGWGSKALASDHYLGVTVRADLSNPALWDVKDQVVLTFCHLEQGEWTKLGDPTVNHGDSHRRRANYDSSDLAPSHPDRATIWCRDLHLQVPLTYWRSSATHKSCHPNHYT